MSSTLDGYIIRCMADLVPSNSPGLNFGNTLRRIRIDAGWSQSRMADVLGLSQVDVSRYETGKVLPPAGRLLDILTLTGWRVSLDRRQPDSPVRTLLGTNHSEGIWWAPRDGHLVVIADRELRTLYLALLDPHPPIEVVHDRGELAAAMRGHDPRFLCISPADLGSTPLPPDLAVVTVEQDGVAHVDLQGWQAPIRWPQQS